MELSRRFRPAEKRRAAPLARPGTGRLGSRCLRQEKATQHSAAVGKPEEKRKPERFSGHRKAGKELARSA